MAAVPSPASPKMEKQASFVSIDLDDDYPNFTLDVGKEVGEALDYERIVRLLTQMGFDEADAAAAGVYGRTLDGAFEFLTADRAVDQHSFIAGDSKDCCAICFKSQDQHTATLVDEKALEPRPRPTKDDWGGADHWVDIHTTVLAGTDEKGSVPDGQVLCKVCYCEYPAEELAELQCGHMFCRDCIAGWLHSQICDGKVTKAQICCPNDECRKPISAKVVLLTASKEDYEKYEKFVKNMEIETNSNARWCGNPDTPCDAVIYRTTAANKKITCWKCGYTQCFKCGKPYHGYFKSCTAEVDAAFADWARDQINMKRCPRCRKFIIKSDGCNHMTCSCGYEFCWVCGGVYYSGHFAAFNPFGCPGMQYARTNGIRHNNIVCRILLRFFMSLVFLSLFFIALGLLISVLSIVVVFQFLGFFCILPCVFYKCYQGDDYDAKDMMKSVGCFCCRVIKNL